MACLLAISYLASRQEDLKARDEFHQRMVKKDKEKQRNIVVKVMNYFFLKQRREIKS